MTAGTDTPVLDHRCPGCQGARLAPHPAFDPLRCVHADPRCRILTAEDVRRVADDDLVWAHWSWEPRPSTPAEIELLAAFGADGVPFTTIVTSVTNAVLRRSFLDDQGRAITIPPDLPVTEEPVTTEPVTTEPSTEPTTEGTT